MRCLLLAVVLLLAAGCGSSSNDPEVAASWTATVRMVGHAWLEGEVPRVYAARALRAAADALGHTDGSAADTALRLRAAVEREDRAEARRIVGP